MPIFEKNGRRVAFIHIPKAAGSSVEQLFTSDGWTMSFYKPTYDGYTVSDQHRTYQDLKEKIPDLDQLESFAITRDPFSRLVSEWGYQTKRIKSSKLNFNDFVRHLECSLKVDERYWDNHYRPQTDFIDDGINAVIKMEDIREGLPRFLRENGIMDDPKIPHVNRLEKRRGKPELCMSREAEDRILRVYERDFAELGYEPTFLRHAEPRARDPQDT